MRFKGFTGLPWAAPSRSSSRLGRWMEALLFLILAVQVARLFWVALAPSGSFGDWRPYEPAIPAQPARLALFSAFDPFYRQAAAPGEGVQQVTSLPFQLFGIRINEGSGQGSAIIADESGVQTSFAVGEEIAPGVTLSAVAYDHVTISRGGVAETLYLDQSGGAPAEGAPQETAGTSGSGGPGVTTPPVTGETLSAQALTSGIGFAPRLENGAVTGIALNPQGSSDAFARAGFRPGDVVAQINGAPIRSAEDVSNLRASLRPGARITLMVERGSATVPIALIIPDNK